LNALEKQNSNEFTQNIIAALSVSFVAISLGAAFGILSGRGAFAGMLSAGLIALITSLLGGTRVQCSGPTAPMTAVTVAIVVAAQSAVEGYPGLNVDHFINLTILMTAALLLLAAVLRLGKYISFVPNVVISGFMNGIAVLIWLDQIYKLFGIGGKEAFGGELAKNLGITLFCLVLLFLLPATFRRFVPRFASLFSPTLLTIFIGASATHLLGFDIQMVSLSASINSFQDITNLVASQIPQDFSSTILWLAFPFALQLTFLAYLDTLLTSLVVDKLTHEKTKANKELMAQGVAAVFVGIVGGLPGAQATIRSVLIIKEKATMRLAGILVGIFVLVEILLFQNAISLIPQAVFAGVLIKVGYDVFDWTPLRLYMKELFGARKTVLQAFFSRQDDAPILVANLELLMIIGTTVVTIVFDLNTAVISFTLLFYLYNKGLGRKNPMRDLRPLEEGRA